jgi:hypothetical protein
VFSTGDWSWGGLVTFLLFQNFSLFKKLISVFAEKNFLKQEITSLLNYQKQFLMQENVSSLFHYQKTMARLTLRQAGNLSRRQQNTRKILKWKKRTNTQFFFFFFLNCSTVPWGPSPP